MVSLICWRAMSFDYPRAPKHPSTNFKCVYKQFRCTFFFIRKYTTKQQEDAKPQVSNRCVTCSHEYSVNNVGTLYDYTSIYIAWRTLLYTYHIDYSFLHRAPVCINNFITKIILQFVIMYMSSLRPFLKNHRFRPAVPFAFFGNVLILIS